MKVCRPSSNARSGRQAGVSPLIVYPKLNSSRDRPCATDDAASTAARSRLSAINAFCG